MLLKIVVDLNKNKRIRTNNYRIRKSKAKRNNIN